MTRYNTIHKINDTWGSYEEKGKTPQWVNLKTGERYDIKNKETFTEFFKRLEETNNMTLKTISDKPQTFTFTYDFEDIDTAKVASNAVFGYMFGTYHAPVIEATIKGKGQLVLEYAEDKKLSKIFKRICDGFKDYYTHQGQENEIKEDYKLERVQQLKQSEDFDSLLDKVVAYELELMELADSVLDDDYPDMAVNGVHGNLEAVDNEAMALLKSLDTENEYKALWKYASREA
ncbi:hypothetical protein JavanS54_0014 [Streptococcus satellite phage Javan54]|nr:hypothetical protein JavanS54_0014 [Streptococcus satellite phage Javan54]CCW41053.1 FIG01115461: hypothetical protein [Streptococcus agalactiae ILRI005]